jgi:hypothetical protein
MKDQELNLLLMKCLIFYINLIKSYSIFGRKEEDGGGTGFDMDCDDDDEVNRKSCERELIARNVKN